MNLNVYKMFKKATLPTKATKNSACFDLSVCLHGSTVLKFVKGGEGIRNIETDNNGNRSIVIRPNERIAVPTGLIFDIPEGYSLRVYPRSGLSLKNGITLANNVAVIDSDYKEELFIIITNISQDIFVIPDGMRIAQFDIVKDNSVSLEQIDEKPERVSDRDGGLGSTGTGSKTDKSTNTQETKNRRGVDTRNTEVYKEGEGKETIIVDKEPLAENQKGKKS